MSRRTIAVIDDENINLKLISGLLEDSYQVHLFNDGDTFLSHKFDHEPLLILLDIVMPKKDGFEVMHDIKNSKYADIPVIFLTAKSDVIDEKHGIELGAVDYITKPFSHEVLKLRIETQIKFLEMRRDLQIRNNHLHTEVEKRIKDIKVIQDLSLGLIAQVVEQRDLETANHIYRTYAYVQLISKALSHHKKYKGLLNDSMIERISKASILHDIGKVSIPDYILLKPGKLTDSEYQEMKLHVEYGRKAIEQAIQFISQAQLGDQTVIEESLSFFYIAKDIAYYHHERYDGKGYLEGLKGEDIPLPARIMAIADVFDALVSKRIYKEAWDFDQALDYIKSEAGRLFDPILVSLFVKHKKEVFEIYSKYVEE